MIKMVKGTYGRVVNGEVEAMTPHSAPFSLPESREAELVAAGVAVKVEEPVKANNYAGLKMAELRRIAEARGVDVRGARAKDEVIALLEAASVEIPVWDDDERRESGLFAED